MTDETQSQEPDDRFSNPGPSPQPEPFADRPGDPPGGCSRPLLIGCAATTVLLGLLLLGLLWKARDFMPALFRWSLDQVEQQVTSSLPAGFSEEDRQRLSAAFDAAATAVEDGSADPAALQRLQGELLEVVRAGKPTREQVLDLVAALEAVAGDRAPPPPREALPEPAETALPTASQPRPAGDHPAFGSPLPAA